MKGETSSIYEHRVLLWITCVQYSSRERYVNAMCIFPMGDTRGTCRSTARFTCVTIMKPVGYTQHTRGKSTPMQPTEVFVL